MTRLTERHERPRDEPWAVTDAPATYVDKQLRAIVGLEMTVERVEAKAKLSQNRSEADRAGVVAGLRREGRERDAQVADDDGPRARRRRLSRRLSRGAAGASPWSGCAGTSRTAAAPWTRGWAGWPVAAERAARWPG